MPTFELAAFGTNAGGWSSDDLYPRTLADVNADGMADIVGFGSAGVYVALATGNGHFASSILRLTAFGPNAGGWSSNDTFPREVADITGDAKADIVGFGSSGVWSSASAVSASMMAGGGSVFTLMIHGAGDDTLTVSNGINHLLTPGTT
jgi:FG-GAP-like repeat